MKFGQLVEFKMKNIFLEKLEPTFHTQSFSATEASILKLRCCPFALTLYRSFYKSKKRSVTSLPASFFPLFFKKNISTLYFINWPNFIALYLLLLKILGNICIVIICCSVCDVINLKNNLSLLIKPFFYITIEPRQRCKYVQNGKSFWHEIKSIFHKFWTAFSCQKLSQTLKPINHRKT